MIMRSLVNIFKHFTINHSSQDRGVRNWCHMLCNLQPATCSGPCARYLAGTRVHAILAFRLFVDQRIVVYEVAGHAHGCLRGLR